MSKVSMPWPKKGNKAFASAKGGKSFHLQPFAWHDNRHAEGFKNAAEMVIDACVEDRFHNDEMIFPVAYLYRHCLELKFKDLIIAGIHVGFFTKAKVAEVLASHNLANLWNKVKGLLNYGWPNGPKSPLQGIESVVNEFHQADPDGQTFRYNADKKGKRHKHEKLPEFIGMENLRTTMDGIFSLLDACESMFRENLDYTY
jgi:hypothetical protein